MPTETQFIPAQALLDWLLASALRQRDVGHILQSEYTMATREGIRRALKTGRLNAELADLEALIDEINHNSTDSTDKDGIGKDRNQ